MLAVVQLSLAFKLLTAHPSSAEGQSPTAAAPTLPAPVPSMVPEIGQIALPPSAVTAPPLPGSLMPAPPAAPPVSNAPPPIGSFDKIGAAAPMPAPSYVPQAPPTAAMPVVPAAPAPSSVSAPAPVPSPSPAMPGSPPSFAPPSASGTQAAGFKTTAPAGPNSKPDAATALLKDVNYVLTAAKELRGLSDMQGTLELLRKADELTPDHPAIIAEMAQTYEQMGLTAKATDAWRRIQLLGATKAGSYFELASRRLGSGSAAVTAPGLSAPSGEIGRASCRERVSSPV